MASAEGVAEGVDLLFGVVGGGEVDVVVVVAYVVVHDVEGVLDEVCHVVEVVVEVLVEVDGGFAFVFACHGYLVDDVAYAFEVVDDAEHGGDVARAFGGEVGCGFGEVFGNFHFHAVGYVLVFFDVLECVVEFVVGGGGAQAGQEGEHAEYAFGEVFYFVLCGLEVEFGGVGEASADEPQAEFVFLLFGRGFDHEVDDFDELGYEEGEDEGVDDVEEGVEDGDG